MFFLVFSVIFIVRRFRQQFDPIRRLNLDLWAAFVIYGLTSEVIVVLHTQDILHPIRSLVPYKLISEQAMLFPLLSRWRPWSNIGYSDLYLLLIRLFMDAIWFLKLNWLWSVLNKFDPMFKRQRCQIGSEWWPYKEFYCLTRTHIRTRLRERLFILYFVHQFVNNTC